MEILRRWWAALRRRGRSLWARPRRLIAVVLAAAVVGAAIVWSVWPDTESFRTEDRLVQVRSGPSGAQPIDLDTTLYVPESARSKPAPAVLLAHGFAGSKRTVATEARALAGRGYVVLAWTSRGFGDSGGEIHLNSPDYEVRDAQRLIDWLAARPDVQLDGANDPRVAAVGGSYGGALSLLLAGHDARVDAIVPQITWNDLAASLLPESSGRGPIEGVFKRQWAGLFFGAGSGLPTLGGSRVEGSDPAANPQCGRYSADICAVYLEVATTGRATTRALELLRRSSPAGVLSQIKAPTLLIQGQADTLFPLSEADANARGIAANGTPVKVAWFSGGHDGGRGSPADAQRVRGLAASWLDHYLRGRGAAPADSFSYSRVTGIDTRQRGPATTGYRVPSYPGLSGQSRRTEAVTGDAQRIANPPDGNPSAISSLPGLGSLGALAGISVDVPGQYAKFESKVLDRAIDVVGAPKISIRVASPTGSAVLFIKLYDVGDETASLPQGLVAPIRLTGLPSAIDSAAPVEVTLPAIAHRFAAGHRLRVVVATSDQAFTGPANPTVYTVEAASPITLPDVRAVPLGTASAVWRWVLAALIATLAVGLGLVLFVAWQRRRRRDRSVRADLVDKPLVVRGLRKAYPDGYLAVSHVDFSVARGQVVGLLGPNGAGKTTTMRTVLGLIRPTGGEIYLYGHRVEPGAPVLQRVGALVEGPGFLPHLSGRDNLLLYWKATGRPLSEAKLDDVLEIAALGPAVERRVKTYSHGMKQRLAIAQAMLGMPELLLLDEPTDGLDPPQIAEMRRVLRRYADGGRAVLVSSHLLAEVEQTCTHVVVVHQGRVVAEGAVGEIVGETSAVVIDVSDLDGAEAALREAGVADVARESGGLVVNLNGVSRRDAVATLVNAGVGVDRVAPKRRLEDAFLALVEGEK